MEAVSGASADETLAKWISEVPEDVRAVSEDYEFKDNWYQLLGTESAPQGAFLSDQEDGQKKAEDKALEITEEESKDEDMILFNKLK